MRIGGRSVPVLTNTVFCHLPFLVQVSYYDVQMGQWQTRLVTPGPVEFVQADVATKTVSDKNSGLAIFKVDGRRIHLLSALLKKQETQ